MKTENKKKIYVLPETNVVELDLNCPILEASYTEGGGGIFEDDDIIDNGSY